MSPRALMIFGSSVGVSLVFISIWMPDTISTTAMCIFAAGMLFGKGYGIWEERGRPNPPSEGETR